jgi:hypothetical protein
MASPRAILPWLRRNYAPGSGKTDNASYFFAATFEGVAACGTAGLTYPPSASLAGQTLNNAHLGQPTAIAMGQIFMALSLE